MLQRFSAVQIECAHLGRSHFGALGRLVPDGIVGWLERRQRMGWYLILPGVLALSLESIFMNDLAGRGLPPVVIVVPGVGLALNLALNLVFIPRFGLSAAAAASSIAYGVMLAIAWTAFARRAGTPPPRAA